jgi:uncharacterized membrane protein
MERAVQWTREERIAGWSVLAAVLALALLTLWGSFTGTEPRELQAGSDLVLPLAQLKTNKLFLFRYRIDPSTAASVAVQRGADGIIRAALASCRSCFKSRNYEWSGKLVCGHCRHVMKMPDPVKELDVNKSGCALTALEYVVGDDSLSVRGDIIKAEFALLSTGVRGYWELRGMKGWLGNRTCIGDECLNLTRGQGSSKRRHHR